MTTKKRWIFFKINLLAFSKKKQMNLAYLFNINNTDQTVQKEILKLNLNNSCWPDETHPQILTELIGHLYKPLALLQNKTMQGRCIPQDWKKWRKLHQWLTMELKTNKSTTSLVNPAQSDGIVFIKELINLLSAKQYSFINDRSTIAHLL